MNDTMLPTLSFDCADNELLRLSTMLQSGFIETGRQGDSILSFLLSLDGFTESYIENEVQTVFYNGDALDDVETELAGKTAAIALGSAMPGLAGAIMRKGSICGAFRKKRTVVDMKSSGEPVTVRVKLFNSVARERGPQLLSRGLKIDGKDLLYFLKQRPLLITALKNIRFDGQAVQPDDLLDMLTSCDRILVKARNNE
ncbi:MAG: hypothetical protein P8X39_10565 [Desulfofustis sp.]